MPPPVRRFSSHVLVAAAAALALAGAAVADDNAGFTPRDPASPGAERIMDSYWMLVALGGLIFLVVTIPLLTFIVRYRSRGRGREIEGPQVRGNSRLEVGWTLGAVLLATALVSFVFYKLPGIVDPGQATAGQGFRITVEGRQFYWRYVYPNGVIAYDTLRLPVDRQVTFDVTAPDADVIHSFWIPNMAGKRDAIPGQSTSFDVLPEKLGEFDVICGEFCGIQHAVMRGEVQVVPQAEFDTWLDEQEQAQRQPSAELGGSIWVSVCGKCHGEDTAGEVGPRLEGNPLLADRQALARVVRQGRGAMPAVGQEWTDFEVSSLVEFTKALAGGGGDGGEG
jgi:cytochrome c oxidase subunit 2